MPKCCDRLIRNHKPHNHNKPKHTENTKKTRHTKTHLKNTTKYFKNAMKHEWVWLGTLRELWLWINIKRKCVPKINHSAIVRTLLSLSLSLSLSLPWRFLCNCVEFPLAQTSSRRKISPDPRLSAAESRSPLSAPPMILLLPRRRRWPWTPISTRRCSGRTWRGARTIIGKGSVTRKRLSSSWTASTPVSLTLFLSLKFISNWAKFLIFASVWFPRKQSRNF